MSRKIRSAKRFRAQRGYFLSPFAPYGYIKAPADRHHLLIDPEAAETVRRIFRMASDGKSTEQIARTLNREAVPAPALYKRAAGCPRSRWNSIWEDNFWTAASVIRILRDERYIGKNIYGKRIRDVIGSTHSVKVSRTDWIVTENTHEEIITPEEFDRAQAQIRAYVERNVLRRQDWPLCGRVRCGVCGYAMAYTKGTQRYFYCSTPRVNDAFTCAGKTPEDEILDAVKEGLHVQALAAVDLSRLWQEQYKSRKKDTAAMVKTLSKLREAYQQLTHRLNGLYKSFVLGEISKSDYFAIKAASVKQRDALADRITELESALDNTGTDGSLRNGFVSAFEKYMDVAEITSEIASEVLKEVRIYPDKRLEIIWNFRDELEKLVFDLQGAQQNGSCC